MDTAGPSSPDTDQRLTRHPGYPLSLPPDTEGHRGGVEDIGHAPGLTHEHASLSGAIRSPELKQERMSAEPAGEWIVLTLFFGAYIYVSVGLIPSIPGAVP